MGLVLLIGALVVVSIILHSLSERNVIGHRYDIFNTVSFVMENMLIVIFIFVIVFSTISYTILKMSYDANQIKYDSLMFKLESIEEVTDVLEIRNLDIINEVEEWNANLAVIKQVNDSKMIGMFVPDEYENFKFIDLKINS